MFGNVLSQLAKVVYRLVMALEHQQQAIHRISTGNGLMAGIELEAAKEHLEEGKKQAEKLLKRPFKDWNSNS